ncbi:hypothetical protein ACIHAR_18550, partial [Streptomyces sp. NPDC052016]
MPLSLEEEILLPVGTAYTGDETLVAGAPRILALAERLSGGIGLPLDVIPEGRNLDLSLWFLEGGARKAAEERPGPWSGDLDAAFYVALYLRAAQYSLRYGLPHDLLLSPDRHRGGGGAPPPRRRPRPPPGGGSCRTPPPRPPGTPRGPRGRG